MSRSSMEPVKVVVGFVFRTMYQDSRYEGGSWSEILQKEKQGPTNATPVTPQKVTKCPRPCLTKRKVCSGRPLAAAPCCFEQQLPPSPPPGPGRVPHPGQTAQFPPWGRKLKKLEENCGLGSWLELISVSRSCLEKMLCPRSMHILKFASTRDLEAFKSTGNYQK